MSHLSRKTVFMFSGQGSQYYQMGRNLFENHAGFRRRMQKLDERVAAHLGGSVLDRVFAEGMSIDDPFDHLLYSSPSIFMVEYSLARVLIDKGIEPDYVLGTSLGEFTAAALAGVVGPEKMLEMIVVHSKKLESLCEEGAMIAVLAEPDLFAKDPVFAAHADLAAVNFDEHFVVSGSPDNLSRLTSYLQSHDISFERLPVSRAFHSSMVEPAKDAFQEYLRRQSFRASTLPLVSCVHGKIITDLNDDYLWTVVRKPVRFREALSVLRDQQARHIYLDVGPSGTLATFARHCLEGSASSRIFRILTPFGRDLENLAEVQDYYARSDSSEGTPSAESGSEDEEESVAGESTRKTFHSKSQSVDMKVYVFPGQGSQKKGMGSGLFEAFPDLVARVDDILGYSVRELCMHDPEGNLNQTQYTQPALFTVNVLAYLARQDEGSDDPDYLAGHSLGEYNSLFAAGVFDFETGLRLVQERGRLMAEIKDGGMAAVMGLTEDEVRTILTEHGLDAVDIANCNSPRQHVISGLREDIHQAASFLEDAGAQRYLPLNVSGAFHSRYMEPVQEKFASFLDGFTFEAPSIPVISNVEARPYSPDRISELLTRQLTESVRWNESVQYLLAQDDEVAFEEVGPGDVLTKLVHHVRQDAPTSPQVGVEDDSLTEMEEQVSSEATSTSSSSAEPASRFDKHQASVTNRKNPETDERETGAQEMSGSRGDVDGLPSNRDDSGTGRSKQGEADVTEPAGSRLGASSFRSAYGVEYAYVAGSMARGVSSTEFITRLSRAGLLGFFGTHKLPLNNVEEGLRELQQRLGEKHPYGANLVNTPSTPEKERRLVDLFLRYDVRVIEAAGYVQINPALVRYRLHGLDSTAHGDIQVRNRVLAKVARPEVAEAFLRPAPEGIVDKLLEEERITSTQAELARRVPMADDLCVQADSAWRTSMGTLSSLLPVVWQLRDKVQKEQNYAHPIHVGAAGGIGTPAAIASAFLMGADFILTGSVNLCTVESGMSSSVKDELMEVNVQDTDYAPAAEMFVMGEKMQVLKKGTFFPARARKLYNLYRQNSALSEINEDTRAQLEQNYFQRSLEEVYEEIKRARNFGASREIDRAEKDPKFKMALIFRWYLNHAADLALRAEQGRRVDFQVPCGPALGAFNQWAEGTDLESWRERHVEVVAEELMEKGAAFLHHRLQTVGMSSRASADTTAPKPPEFESPVAS